MRFTCDQCGAQYMIADEKVGDRGVKVRCKKCQHIIVVRPQAPPTESAGSGFDPHSQQTVAFDRSSAFGQTGQQLGNAFDSVFGDDNPFNAPTQAMDADQLAALRAQAAGGGDTAGGGLSGLGAAVSAASFEQGVSSSASTPAPAPAASPTTSGPKEWYVAIDESQVGPIDVAEIERRWDALELDEDSLAWKAGMSDWLPVAEIAELAYLVTERPQRRPAAAGAALAPAGSQPFSSPSQVGGAAASLGPAALGGGRQDDGIAWKPSAASALSSLVQEELDAAAAPPKEESKPMMQQAPMGMDMPTFGANELFGAAGAAPAAPAVGVGGMGMGAQVGDPFSGGGGWSMPSTPRRPASDGKRGLLLAIVGAGGAVIIGLLVVLVLQVTGHGFAGSRASAPGGEQQQANTPPPGSGEKPSTPAPSSTGGTSSKPPPSRSATSERPKQPPRRSTKPSRTASRPKPPPPPRPSRERSKKESIDDVFGPTKESITRDDIFSGIKGGSRHLKVCMDTAKSRGELAPGRYTFKLSWTIKPNGSVSNARLTEPASVLGTSLPRCFAAALRRCKFPATKNGAPVRNFPMGYTVQ